MQSAIFGQEERRLPRPFNYFSVGIGQCLPPIMQFGTEEQKQLIPRTLRGDLLWCQLFSEPNAGIGSGGRKNPRCQRRVTSG